VVIVTAEASAAQARELLQAGAQAYLSKPLDLAEFFRTIDELLEPQSEHVAQG
jgi:CheY-like chemotaxis protein